jgi:hypothetical protein
MSPGVLGRWVLAAAAVLAMAGVVLLLLDRIGVGRLPGDLVWRRNGVTIYFPIGIMILLSILLTIVLNLILRR